MVDGVFTRGTTPTQVFSLPYDLTIKDIRDVAIAYRQKGKTILVKHLEDCHFLTDLDSEKDIVVILSQEETLLFNPRYKVAEVEFKVSTVGSDVIPIAKYTLRVEDGDETVMDLS
jgi:hypothetical protein